MNRFLAAISAWILALSGAGIPGTADASSLYALARVSQGFTSICQQGGPWHFPGDEVAEAHCVVPPEGGGFLATAGDAESSSAYGTLRGYTQLQTTAADGRSYEALATSAFTDSFTIKAPGHAQGSSGSGRVTFTVDVEHLTIERDLTDGFAYPDTDFFVDLNGSHLSPHGTMPDLYYFFSFQYGVPFEFTATLQTKVVCSSCSGRYDILTDGRHTATLDLVTVSGLELSDFTISSGSGVSFANVVPEPGVAVVALVAALAFAVAAGHKRPAAERKRLNG